MAILDIRNISLRLNAGWQRRDPTTESFGTVATRRIGHRSIVVGRGLCSRSGRNRDGENSYPAQHPLKREYFSFHRPAGYFAAAFRVSAITALRAGFGWSLASNNSGRPFGL